MILTAEQIAKQYETKADINRYYRSIDESHLWPINNKFNCTERAIRKVRKFEREGGYDLQGLEYCYTLEICISEIVNNSNNW
jgi:hypothetical protein